MFDTKQLPADADVIAPDGSQVRILLGLAGGTMAHFQLGPGATSVAVHHRSVEELWYFVAGAGEMWRRDADGDSVVAVAPGTCVSIPLGTHFQFRNTGDEALAAVGITMPPWPGDGEAIRSGGKWEATVDAGPGLATEW